MRITFGSISLRKAVEKLVRIPGKLRGSAPGSLQRQEARLGYALISPGVLLLVALYLMPLVTTLLASFEPGGSVVNVTDAFRLDNVTSPTLEHFVRASNDPIWRKSIVTTMVFVGIVIGVGLPASLVIALVLNEDFRGRGILRAMLLIPWAIPPVVNGTIWGLILHGDLGTLNGLLLELGLIKKYVVWLADPRLALITVSLAVVWRWLPFMSLLILAGLQGIPPELYDAARVDGANAWNRFRFVTLPSLWPVLITVGVIQTMWTTKVFAEFWTLTKGGPSYSTTVMYYWVYKQAFEFLRLGYGSALAYILAALTAGLILFYYLRVLRGGE